MMDICSKITEAQWKEARNATWMPRMFPASCTKRLGKPSCAGGMGGGTVSGRARGERPCRPRGDIHGPRALNFSHLISPSVMESFSAAMRLARSAISGQ